MDEQMNEWREHMGTVLWRQTVSPSGVSTEYINCAAAAREGGGGEKE